MPEQSICETPLKHPHAFLNMDRTVSPRYETSAKRRRVLSDIINTGILHTESHTRRESLGSDLVRIDVSEKTREGGPDKNFTSDMNRRGSSIPTLRNSDKYERFLNISETLNRKCKVHSTDFIYASKTNHASETNKQIAERLCSELETITADLRRATDDLAAIDDEYSHQNMLFRALQTEMAELKNVLQDHESRFDYLLTQTTLKVELKQKGLDVSLREYKTKLENSYNNTRFELENELLQVMKFDDTEAILQIEKLKDEKLQLKAKLNLQLESNNELLLQLEQNHTKQLREKEEKSAEDLESAALAVKEKEEKLSRIDADLLKAQEKLLAQQKSDADFEQQIQSKKELISNFATVKGSWQEQLHDVNAELRSLNSVETSWAQRVKDSQEEYETERLKYEQYQKTRRVLEHALSQYCNGRRTFVRIPDNSSLPQENELFNSEFDKIISHSYSNYSKEWELHVQECLRGSLAALIFSGSVKTNCLKQISDSVLYLLEGAESLDRKKCDLFIQSVRIEGTNLLDLLNRSNEIRLELRDNLIDLMSQKMTLSNPGDIDTAFKNIGFSDKATFHKFTVAVSRTSREPHQKSGLNQTTYSTLCLIDLSKFHMDEQTAYLNGEGPNVLLVDLIDHCFKRFKCVSICDLEDTNCLEARNLLKAVLRKNSQIYN